MNALMRAADYYRDGISNVVPLHSAERPAPSNVTDARFWGDETFADLFIPLSAATADQAAKLSAVNFCCSIIAETVGNCPIEFLEDHRPVKEFTLGEAIAYAPNPMQTGAEFWPAMLFCAALTGHAFADPVVDGEGLYIWPLEPCDYAVDWRRRGFTLTYSREDGRSQEFNPSQLFWFTGLSNACLRPLTPWKMAKGEIDFALALLNQGRSFFQKGARLGAVVESDKPIDSDQFVKLQSGIDRWRTGKIPLLQDGLKLKEVGSKNSDAQFLELLDQRTHEMARYWRIPRSFYASEGGNAKSQEQEAQTFVKYTARPWTRRVEQAITMRLLTPDQRRRLTPKINMDALLRGDSQTQFRNAVLARTASTHSVNELRTDWFGMPRIDQDWADDPRAPLNSNRAADTLSGGETAPQDKVE